MDIILSLTYVAIATVVFKIFKLPVTKWSVTTTALGGVFLTGLSSTLLWAAALNRA